MTRKKLSFCVYIIHLLAHSWDMLPADVYSILNSTGILDDYVISCYDTLHTLGSNYLTEDLTDFVREKGVKV